MPTKANMATFYVLLGLTLVVWAGMLVGLFNAPAPSHDAIGDSILIALGMLLLWGLLLALLWMGGAREAMPKWAKVLAWILHPATFAAAVVVLDRLNRSDGSWLKVVPMVAPLMIAGYACWTYFPGVRGAISAPIAGSLTWGVLLILAILPWAYMIQEDRENEAQQLQAISKSEVFEGTENRAESLVELQKLTADTPLWRWMDFANPRMGVRDEAFAGIRKLNHRQAEADEMLRQGSTHFLVELPNLDLEPTPTIIAAHKKYVLGLTKEIERPDAGGVKYSWVADRIDEYLPSIQWMAERHCGCSGELAVLEAGVRKYKGSVGKAECLEALAKARANDR